MNETPVDPAILMRVKEIVRRDLKLGPQANIPDAMPFFNSEADLDSLDVLLLVSSIEKEFGFKIPSQQVGRAVFENPLTVARFVEERVRAAAPAGQTARLAPAIDLNADLDRLPHGPSFRFITRLTQLVRGQSATALWDLNGTESFFAGHFPGRPIVPGVLLAEAMAQVSGIAGADEATAQGSLAHVDIRFEQPVRPPASIVIVSKLSRAMGQLQQFEVSAQVDQQMVARGTLALHRHPAEAG